MKSKRETMVVLHNIRSLYNVGSIFRTADGAGVAKLYLSGITPAPTDRFGHPRPQIAKVALGAERTVPWEKTKDTIALLKRLSNQGYTIFALEQDSTAKPLISQRAKRVSPKQCLVLGNEVRGLPPSVLRLAKHILEIPMRGKKESLNVSVAFGIAVYWIT